MEQVVALGALQDEFHGRLAGKIEQALRLAFVGLDGFFLEPGQGGADMATDIEPEVPRYFDGLAGFLGDGFLDDLPEFQGFVIRIIGVAHFAAHAGGAVGRVCR
jgi:hypothetical protein